MFRFVNYESETLKSTRVYLSDRTWKDRSAKMSKYNSLRFRAKTINILYTIDIPKLQFLSFFMLFLWSIVLHESKSLQSQEQI